MIFGKGERLLFFRFEDGEDFIDAFVQVLSENGLDSLVVISGIGMLRDFKIGWFNMATKQYETEYISAPHELLHVSGNVSLKGSSLFPHLHVALSGPSRSAVGGHLFGGTVCNTTELFAVRTGDLKLIRDASGAATPLEFRK
ncbi:MAG: PPC domain-containing DNA-binding protein [Kosmotogaceae bacterium]